MSLNEEFDPFYEELAKACALEPIGRLLIRSSKNEDLDCRTFKANFSKKEYLELAKRLSEYRYPLMMSLELYLRDNPASNDEEQDKRNLETFFSKGQDGRRELRFNFLSPGWEKIWFCETDDAEMKPDRDLTFESPKRNIHFSSVTPYLLSFENHGHQDNLISICLGYDPDERPQEEITIMLRHNYLPPSGAIH